MKLKGKILKEFENKAKWNAIYQTKRKIKERVFKYFSYYYGNTLINFVECSCFCKVRNKICKVMLDTQIVYRINNEIMKQSKERDSK
jgi:hypothetical protein